MQALQNYEELLLTSTINALFITKVKNLYYKHKISFLTLSFVSQILYSPNCINHANHVCNVQHFGIITSVFHTN